MEDNILYSRFNFLLPTTEYDKFITVADSNNIKRYNITPSNVTSNYVRDSYICIKTLGTDKLIELRFINSNEALLALQTLQVAISKFVAIKTNPNIVKFNKYFELNDIWVVVHNFGSTVAYYIENPDQRPSVNVTDDDGNYIEGLIKYIDKNIVHVCFNQNVSGWVYIN